jgi:uroporphyrinogen-III synthase
MTQPLAGAGIVVTRPAGRGESLCRRIEAAGGRAVSFPCIDIQPLATPVVDIPAGFAGQETADWLVFTSVAAVEHGIAAASRYRGDETRIAAIGTATHDALLAAGFESVTAPIEHQDSEGLLELPEFTDIRGRKILLVKGHGGRGLLASELAARGASVGRMDVYVRQLPPQSPDVLLDGWRNDRLDAIVISSRDGLENLYTLLPDEGRTFLRRTQLVAPTVRMLKLVQALDIPVEPVISQGASDDAVMNALNQWWRTRQQETE